MGLIKTVKATEKSKISVTISKNLADEFDSEMKIFNTNSNHNISLDFDNLAKKIIAELRKINQKNDLFSKSNTENN